MKMKDIMEWLIVVGFSCMMAIGMKRIGCKTFMQYGKESSGITRSRQIIVLLFAATAISVSCYACFSSFWQRLFVSGITMIVLGIAYIDHQTMIIPNCTICLLLVLSCGLACVENIAFIDRITGFFLISMPMYLAVHIVTDCFGGGDIKLMAVAGFLLGWQRVLLAFLIAVLTGGIYAAWLLFTKHYKGDAHIAFGPYLCSGMIVSLYMGWSILHAYLALLYR